jgi:hypothetical protein
MRDADDDATGVLGAIQRARDAKPIDPIPWIIRALAGAQERKSHATNRSVHAAARRLEETSTRISPLSASAPNPSCPVPVAAKRTRLLLGSYRKGEAEDPEVYTMAIAAVLSDYPESVALRVTDPRTGIAGGVQWLPTAFEVREACEREMPPIPAAQRRDAAPNNSADH